MSSKQVSLDADWLQSTISAIPSDFNIYQRQYSVAQFIITEILGVPWVKRNLVSEEGPSPFFRLGDGRSDRLDNNFYRVVVLGEMLFRLQHVEGFDHCVARLSDDLEATFAELEVAKLLVRSGVKFRFNSPQHHRTSDYDIEIIVPGERHAIPAETKCKIESTSFSAETVAASLKRARGQLPPDQKGVIFVKTPHVWHEDPTGAITIEAMIVLSQVAENFLRNTSRVAMIVYFQSFANLYPDYLVEGFVLTKRNPRAPLPDLVIEVQQSNWPRLWDVEGLAEFREKSITALAFASGLARNG